MTKKATRTVCTFMRSACVLIGLALPVGANPLQDASAMPWKLRNAAALQAAAFPSADRVAGFVKSVIISDPLRDTLDVESNSPAVMDYALVDLKGDGTIELVCRLDFSGRGLSYDLVAIARSPHGFHVALLESPGELGKISDTVLDINNDGKKEVLVSEALRAGRDRSTPVPHFTHVYRYEGGQFVQSDRQFKHYYRSIVLPLLASELAKEEASFKSLPSLSPEQTLFRRQKLDALRQSIEATRQFLAK
jgi:hypothetical protein